MKSLIRLSQVVLLASFTFSCAHGPRRGVAAAGDDKFGDYIAQYAAPQFFQKNSTAMDARIKMLDYTREGDHVRIATFLFDSGEVTRRLSRRVCAAAQRGVDVHLIVDSKAGDIISMITPFDDKEEIKEAQEMFQHMANCGAKVQIHNQIENYVKVFGASVPNIFLNKAGEVDTAQNGVSFPLGYIGEISSIIKDDIAPMANAEFRKNGINSDVNSPLQSLLTFIKYTGYVISKSQTADFKKKMRSDRNDGGNNKTDFEKAVDQMSAAYSSLVRDPFWMKTAPEKLRVAMPIVVKKILAESKRFQAIRTELHRFNRLNHRKLFMVENANRSAGCMILGGRNLGDHYLSDGKESFHDADVMLCHHFSTEASKMLAEAQISFDQLETDLSDGVLGTNDNKIGLVPQVPTHTFQFFKTDKQVAKDAPWADGTAVLGDLALVNATGWKFHKANWDSVNDEIDIALLEMIKNETKEVYIETAYGEFNIEMRDAIEAAVKRGVKVNIVTNSFFISDGGSKGIRILMANWVEYMQNVPEYKDLFSHQFVRAQGGHMTHFKGAGFACQKSDQAKHFLIGSHNFHPRSGFSDKEHALTWTEKANTECNEGFSSKSGDMVAARRSMYEGLKTALGINVLVNYSGLDRELGEIETAIKFIPERQRELAKAIKRVFYTQTVDKRGRLVLRFEPQVKNILKILDMGGVHDLIGLVL